MKTFLNLCLISSLLFGQELHFSLYGDTDQSFPVPFDTTYRHFPIPYDLLEIGTNQQLELVFYGCEALTFIFDDLRFPNNSFIDFETDEYNLSYSLGIFAAQRVQHLTDSGYVLELSFDQNDSGPDTLWVETPENSFPVVPDYVGMTIQADISVNLWDYSPLRNYMPRWSTSRYHSSHPDWDYNTLIETIYSSVTSQDSIVNSTLRWKYSDELSNEVGLGERTYTYRYLEPEKVSINQLSFDFNLELGAHTGGDSAGGVTLVGEQYERILDKPTFVKKYSLDGPVGSNLYFGYGMGIVREDFAGTSVHDDLVGVRNYDDIQGDFEQDVSLSIGFDQDFPVLTTFPPDSNWHHYKIPISKLYYPEGVLPRSMDSLWLLLEPAILTENFTGQIQLADIQLKVEDTGVLYDFTQQGISDWLMNTILNGSFMAIEALDNNLPDETGMGFELMFYNDMAGSTHFGGSAMFHAYFDSTLQVNPEMFLQFWLRQSPTITGIDDEIPRLPEEFGVTAAYPNPFNGEVTINLTIPSQSAPARIVIHDIQGRQKWSREILSGPGYSQIHWNGQDQHGKPLASGLYVVALVVNDTPGGKYQKLVLIK